MKLFLLTTFLAAVSAQNCCNDPDDRDDCFDCCTNQNTEDRCLDRFRSGNGNNGNNGNGDCGYDDKCGHCKQEWCPNLNARDACKADLCSAKELAFYFPEDVVKKSEITLRGSFVALANDCDSPPDRDYCYDNCKGNSQDDCLEEADDICDDPYEREDCFDFCDTSDDENDCIRDWNNGGNNRNNDCGLDDKCGNCKQAMCPNLNARDACKADFCSVEELALYFPEDLIKQD